jgi:hypothetical protein
MGHRNQGCVADHYIDPREIFTTCVIAAWSSWALPSSTFL